MPKLTAPSNPSLRIPVVGAGVSGISIAQGSFRDRHAVEQLGTDMHRAGQGLSSMRVVTSTGRPVSTHNVSALADHRRMSAQISPDLSAAKRC